MNTSLVSRSKAPSATPWSLLLVFTLGAMLGGCTDKAKEKFDECVALEAKWETVQARDACQAAVEQDPNSKSGKAAAGKLTYLNPQADKIVAEEKKKNAPCKVHKWVTRCMWKGKPRPTLLEGDTYAKCNRDAQEMSVIGMTCPVCVCADRFVEPYGDKEE